MEHENWSEKELFFILLRLHGSIKFLSLIKMFYINIREVYYLGFLFTTTKFALVDKKSGRKWYAGISWDDDEEGLVYTS